ncbi:MAG TPA: hypothetical protein VF958_14060 [Thermoanaerobaculia bacterium]
MTRSPRSERPRSPEGRRLERSIDFLSITAIAAHVFLVLSLRVTAWPEVTTPAYLWSRGMLLYRDIKFQHGPGTIGTLALAFLAFGARTWVVRAYAIVWPLLAHVCVLRFTRSFSLAERALGSAFFLTLFFSLDGHAVWPTVVMAAVSLPTAAALSRNQAFRAGLLIGLSILFKQTAAYVLLFASIGLALERRWRSAAVVALVSCIPYWAAAAVFGLLGAGPEMLRWTLEVPLTIRPAFVTARPSAFDASVLVFAFLPTVTEALLERPGEYEVRSRWLLLVAIGFAAICYPRFTLSQTVAAIPCLAVGAARFLRRRAPLPIFRRAAYVLVIALIVGRLLVLASGGDFDGKVLYWNHEPSLDALAERLRRFPPDTPLFSPLWDNVLPRAGLIPPGRLYVNPWFDWFFPVDDVGRRIQEAIRRRGALVVGYRAARADGEVVGPYTIRWVKPDPDRPGR